MTTPQSALQHYNTHFNNKAYQAIGTHLSQDLRADRESLRVSDVMNMLSDVAFQISGHPHYTHASLKLAIFCGQNSVRSYIREKLQSSFGHLKDALHEGLRHADKPHFFDFQTVDFPSPDPGM